MPSIYEINKKKAEDIGKWFRPVMDSVLCNPNTWNHIINNHIAVQKKHMIERILYQGKERTSTFQGKESDIIKMLSDSIQENYKDILLWLADESDDEDFCIWGYLTDNISGILLSKTNDWDNPEVCHSFELFLKKVEYNNYTGFAVRTAYPTI